MDEPTLLVVGPAGAPDLHDVSLCRFLADRRGVTVADIEEPREPASLLPSDARHHFVYRGATVFHSRRLARGASGRMVETGENVVGGALCRLTLRGRLAHAPC